MLVAAPYELPGLVSESLKTVSSPNFFMTIAVRPKIPCYLLLKRHSRLHWS